MSKTNGNAFVYVLIAVTLLGLLTYTLASDDSSTALSDRDEGVVAAQVAEILGYASTVASVYNQMEQSGTNIDSLDTVLPDAGSFNTAPTNHKIYHPDGGGLILKQAQNASYTDLACQAVKQTNWRVMKNQWEWSKTASDDLFINLTCVKKEVCAAINKKLTGSETIPSTTWNSDLTFMTGANDFTIAGCATCERYPALCVYANGTTTAFYSLIRSR